MLRKFGIRAARKQLPYPGSWRPSWRAGILPGLVLTGLVMAARLLGLFESAELKALDLFMRLRPREPLDERVLVVGIDDPDIQKIGTYPVPDQTLAELIQTLDVYQPRAIGIDILRDLPQPPGHEAFVETLTQTPYVFGIEIIGFGGIPTVAPPPSLPTDRIGFIDFSLDVDGFVRRTPLGSFDRTGNYQYSLALRLAEEYLAYEDIFLEQGIKDPSAMRFGHIEIPNVSAHTGGYIGVDEGAQQTLLNVRSNPTPFRQVSLTDVLQGKVPPAWIRDNIVLIGITATSAKDLINSAATVGENPGTVYGVVIHAHAVSQILSAVLDNRPLMRAWPDSREYIWILIWGISGIFLVKVLPIPAYHFLAALGVGLGLVAIAYIALLVGWWIPVLPPLVIFLLNALVVSRIVLYDRMVRSRIEASQRVIRQTYNAMHNGPLQTLALIMRETERTHSAASVVSQLSHLNQEIRHLYTTLEEEIETQDRRLSLEQGFPALDLTRPLHELLYEVYEQTLRRDFPHFKTLRRYVTKFDPLQVQALDSEDIRSLCRFLEGALCNVGLHAEGATQLKVVCGTQNQENTIVIEDNGHSKRVRSPHTFVDSQGSKQAKKLAAELRGTFRRTTISPHGVCCVLVWPVNVSQKRF